MKRLMLLLAGLVLTVNVGPARGASENAYVGIFADSGHNVCSLGPAAYSAFNVWLYWLPGVRGMIGGDFDVIFPSELLVVKTVNNPDMVTIGCGCCEPGIHVCFTSCHQWDWVWTHQLTCMISSGGVGVPGSIRVVPAPGELSPRVATCEPGYPMEPVTVLTDLHLYQSCTYATEPTSWGAIKGLFQ
jgi:hypothetical protein